MRRNNKNVTKVRTFEENSYSASPHSPLYSSSSGSSAGAGGAARAGWGLFFPILPEPALLTLCGGGANPPFSLGNAGGNAGPVPGLGWDFLKSDETAAPLDAVLTFPTERLDTSPEGTEPADPEFSREVFIELADVRRGAGGGVALSAACAAATLDATDTGLSSTSPVSSGSSS